MECNKDEALRAKEIAERKLIEKDIMGSKKFALKAENLFPGLEGLSQFVATLDVYISAEKKINGEIDWYGILGVEALADDETIRKSYRKLALTLHPDKNKSVGAEGAFKILSEAWSLLSDKVKKIAYDQKRSSRAVLYQKVNSQSSSYMPSGNNGFHPFTKNNSSAADHHKTSCNPPQPTQTFPHPSRANTFWTLCNRCHMHYEYSRTYLNMKLACPSCENPFWAVELSHPPINHNPKAPCPPHRQHQNANHQSANKSSPGFGVGSTNSANVQQVPSSSTLKRAKGQASNAGSDSGKGDGTTLKKRHVDENKGYSNRKDTTQQFSMGHKVGSGGDRLSVSRRSKANSMREEVSLSEIRPLLMTKAKMGIREKLDEWSATEASSQKEVKKHKKEKLDAATNNGEDVKVNGVKKDRDMNDGLIQPKASAQPTDSMDSDEKPTEVMLMSVPDPDFHDFDKDRTEKSFGENQVWAAYDDDDGMPRYYALIHSVISKRPFKMRISWLNSKSNSELGPINWVGAGFPKTSGEFRIGKHEINTTLNAFSHKVHWNKGKKGVIQIFPRKGDVWALYKNWSADWSELTPDEVIHKYEMVEVLEDYEEEEGVIVAPLVKVSGFKSVFRQLLDEREIHTIPREEIFRFSHQIPSYWLTGEEAGNASKGCQELDPAALPLELLQVMKESEVNENGNTNANEGLHVSGNYKKSEEKEILTYTRKVQRKSL